MEKILSLITLAFKSLALHKLRSSLTVLGIVFGVASVITMLAVGEGASKEAQDSIKELGSNNIIIQSVKKENENSESSVDTYGITYDDLERIKFNVEGISSTVRQRFYEGEVRYKQYFKDASIIASDEGIFQAKDIKLTVGRELTKLDLSSLNSVCVIDKELAKTLFPYQDPLKHQISYNGFYYKVVGVYEHPSIANTVILPFSTAIVNYGELIDTFTISSRSSEKVDMHELILQLENTEAVYSAAEIIERIFSFSHTIDDYKLKVPLHLLEKAEETKKIFNLLLGSIAGISLLVGGIGIMNIMLATVSERTKEIGLRRALGAKKKDIVLQFMTESVVLSLIGGVAGMLLGILVPIAITHFSGIPTVLSITFVLLSFMISGVTGIIFGSYPAIKSANLSPIEALRDS
ncbi:ABC transporter permease [Akkermansiaceae bacterium]|nr:ABC transporter permease [Akkermansiaceae bacterium]